jgi:hypothetical protein
MISFIIQFKYDSEDRLRNLLRGVIYLHNNFANSEILIIDQDDNAEYLNTLMKEYGINDNVNIKSFNIDGPYHRSKIINEGLKLAKNSVCLIYDCDILIPVEQVNLGLELINLGYDLVFPYTSPQYDIPQDFFEEFFVNYDFNYIKSKIPARQYGVTNDEMFIKYGNAAFCMMLNKKSLGNLIYFNEEFNGWGYEDNEYIFRMDKFGAKITRVWGSIYHVEHERTLQYQYNDYTEKNRILWENIKSSDYKSLEIYYKNLNLIN